MAEFTTIEDFIGKYNHETVGLFNGGVPPLIPKATMQALVQDIADTFLITAGTTPVLLYADITALLANTDLILRQYAFVTDASDDPDVEEGWALYLFMVNGVPEDLTSYQLIQQQYPFKNVAVMIDTAYDASGDLFPTVGNGPLAAVRKMNQYIVGTESATPGMMPVGTILTAKEHDPGQDDTKWHRNYGGE